MKLSQTEKQIWYHLMWNLNNDTIELIYKKETDLETIENKHGYQRGKGQGSDKLGD